MSVIAEADLGDLVILWKKEGDRIVRIEYDKGYEDEALEEEVDDLTSSILETLARELKMPSAVLGRLKELLKTSGPPFVIKLRNEGYTSYIDIIGKTRRYIIKINYIIA